MDIDKMEAGPEMDALVAELMGYICTGNTPEGKPLMYEDGSDVLIVIDDKWTPRCPHRRFLPSTDISAAWPVVEKMQSNDWFFDVYDTSSHELNVSFIYYTAGENVRGEACEKSMPLAICRAALKAVE